MRTLNPRWHEEAANRERENLLRKARAALSGSGHSLSSGNAFTILFGLTNGPEIVNLLGEMEDGEREIAAWALLHEVLVRKGE